MRKKKAASKETISAKMQELHLLVDKWEERCVPIRPLMGPLLLILRSGSWKQPMKR